MSHTPDIDRAMQMLRRVVSANNIEYARVCAIVGQQALTGTPPATPSDQALLDRRLERGDA